MNILDQYAKKAGLPPGEPVFTGTRQVDKPSIEVIQYSNTSVRYEENISLRQAFDMLSPSAVTWINIAGLHDISIIEEAGKKFAIHPLILEDIVHLSQRPKIEEMDSYIFFVLRIFTKAGNEITDEQISIILGENVVITFQEKPSDTLSPLKKRIKTNKLKKSDTGADYITCCILDILIDTYFVLMEEIEDHIEFFENEELLFSPSVETLQEIQKLKKQIVAIRRSAWPVREIISTLSRSDSKLISQQSRLFIRDIYGHSVHIVDIIENYRENLSGMLDIYLSSMSNRMNEVMKTLTIIATIFMPLSFMAGIYGMNFKYMPELNWRWGYFTLWGIMIITAFLMVIFFKRKKWL